MAGHGDLNSLVEMPEEMKKQIQSYELNYNLDWSYNCKIDYID